MKQEHNSSLLSGRGTLCFYDRKILQPYTKRVTPLGGNNFRSQTILIASGRVASLSRFIEKAKENNIVPLLGLNIQ